MGNLGLRSLLTLGLWLALLGAIVALHRIQPPPGLAVAGPWSVTPLEPAGPALVTALPHRWGADGPRRVLYTTHVDLPAAPADPWMLYLPSLNLNAAVAVNGMRVGDGGRMQEPLARHRCRPLRLDVPAHLLRAGANEIAVEVVAQPPGSGFLQQAYLGPVRDLQPYFDLRHFLKAQFLSGLAVAVAMLGAIMLVVWAGRRHERVFLWYALTSAAFVVYTTHFVVSEPPLPSVWWDWVYSASITAFVAAITVFGLHFLGLSQPRLVRGMTAAVVAGLGALALLAQLHPESFQFWSARVWHTLVLGFGVYPVSLFVRELWRRSDARSFWMLASATSLLVGGAHDVLLNARLIEPYSGNYLGYMVPLPISVFTWIMLERFLHALRDSESLNRELNERVRQKQAELERSYEELKKLEAQRVLAEERERIQRDMHDGLGGTLVSTLAGLEMDGSGGGSAAQSLRAALDDLRLMIYSLDEGGSTLRAALGMLRSRLARLAEDSGLALAWNVDGLPGDLTLERGVTLQVMRIVQEAFANTVKHARAKTFGLTATAAGGALRLDMHDDGAGFDAAGVKPGGYGLANMKVRAQKIGGSLNIAAGGGGTCVSLSLPAPIT